MRNTVKSRQSLGNNQWDIIVELFPETDIETKALKQIERDKVVSSENKFIDDYLLFCLGNEYSLIKADPHSGNTFAIIAFKN